uniref:Uncharacterized protein n=1 Tax=Lygus hesperus TaxID=30085 RepID=A0A146MH64_LYGHE
MENKKNRKERLHKSWAHVQEISDHDAATSAVQLPAESTRRPRPVTVQCSVKKRALLAAIEAVKNLEPRDESSSTTKLHYRITRDYHRAGRYIPVRHVQKANLLVVLQNAMNHHDWSTAALVLKFMCDANYETHFIGGPVFQVLFNHPESTDETVQQFLSEGLNLRTDEEQQSFLGHLFHLPQYMDVYNDKNNFNLAMDYQSED